MNELYQEFGRTVEFFVVYIQEAHPSDAWQMPSNIRDNVVFASPRTFDERAVVGESCVRKLGIRFPAVVDDFSNSTEHAYTGWPDRMYLIDTDGRIAYKSRPGPFGFVAAELRAALQHIGTRQAFAPGSSR